MPPSATQNFTPQRNTVSVMDNLSAPPTVNGSDPFQNIFFAHDVANGMVDTTSAPADVAIDMAAVDENSGEMPNSGNEMESSMGD